MKEEVKNNELNLSRQSKLVPEGELKKWTFHIFGVGSVGGPVAQILSKTGFENIEVYDMDNVEKENIGPQAFFFEHLKQKKVDAIKDICKRLAGIDIKTHHGQVTVKTKITVEPNSMYLLFFDSIEGRKMVWDKVKDMPCIVVDGRIGKFDIRYYLIDTIEEPQREEYEKSFPKGKISELVCGEKCSAMINYELGGRIVNNIVNYLAGRDYDKIFIGNTTSPETNIHIRMEISQEKEEESGENNAGSEEELGFL